MKKMLSVLLLVIASLSATPVAADVTSWPQKEVTIVVPFPPGGTVDRIARQLSIDLPTILKKPVVVKNVPGANSVIAMREMTRSDPDHTFIISLVNIVSTQISMDSDLYQKFQPVMVVGSSQSMVFKNNAATVASITESIKNKKGIAVAIPDLIDNGGMWVDRLDGFNAEVIPFKGAAQMISGVMQGEPALGVCSVFCMWPWVSQRQLEPLFVAGDKRNPFLPNTPSAKEFGLKSDRFNYDSVYIISSTTSIDPAVAEKFNNVLKFVATNNAQIQGYGKIGMEIKLLPVKQSKKVWDDAVEMSKNYFKK